MHRWRTAYRASLPYAARSLAAAVGAQLARHIALAEVLASSLAVLESDLTGFESEARRAFVNLDETWVLVADFEGRQLMNLAARPGENLPRRTPGSITAQQRAVASALTVVSAVVFGPVGQDWVATIDMP